MALLYGLAALDGWTTPAGNSVAVTALLEVSNGSVISQPAAAAVPAGALVTVDS